MADLQAIVNQIGELKLLELKELVDLMEKEFGVSAAPAAGMMMMAGPGGGGAAAAPAEEKTEFTVVLKDAGADKIKVIKEVRALTGLGLKEAKDAVEGAPTELLKDVAKDAAEEAKKKLEAVGAVVEVK